VDVVFAWWNLSKGVRRGLFFLLLVFGACLDPTEIRASFYTDVDCGTVTHNRVSIRIGSTVVEANACSASDASIAPNYIGDLVLVPSGSSDPVITQDQSLSRMVSQRQRSITA
jgi:bifunctional N-acetylglucosamine-1-phosphate-uridyltransferase/glucosamine-1-phosphate-acetyltransferase GlmU-like protein